jgi:predicted RNase H-like nuclease
MNKCQWLGNNSKISCGCDAVIGRSYCEEHLWQVYQQGSNLSRRKKDIRVANQIWDVVSEINDIVAELIEEGEIEL